MHRIHVALTALLLTFPPAMAGPPPVGVPDGLSFEAFAHPERPEAFLFVRFAEPRAGEAVVTVRDAAGEPVIALSGTLESGSTMIVWDGLSSGGRAVPAGDYTASLEVGEDEHTVSFTLPAAPDEAPQMK